MIKPITDKKIQSLGAQSGVYIPTLSTPDLKVPDHAFPKYLVFYDNYLTLKTQLESVETLTSIMIDDSSDESLNFTRVQDYVDDVLIFKNTISTIMVNGSKGKLVFMTIDAGFSQTIAFKNYDDAYAVRDLIVGWQNAET